MAQTDCSICCEQYNRSNHAQVKCEFGDCGFSACKACYRQYLLTIQSDPCCMECKKGFSHKFIIDNLNRSFVNKDYKKSRAALLLDMTMSKLPEAQPQVELHMQLAAQRKKVKQLNAAAKAAKKAAIDARQELYRLERKKPSTEARKFIMGCPRDECRGFLSSAYKCGLCNYHVCKDCLCVKGPTANSQHECNPDDVATAQLIKAQTKPCPSCGERISKIEGCDQMWCTSCHTAFSWRTGRIDNGVVHNPHFFQYQNQNQNQNQNQQQGLNQCNVQQLPAWNLLRPIRVGLKNYCRNQPDPHAVYQKHSDKIDLFIEMCRFMSEIHEVNLPRLRQRITSLEDTMPLRLAYLLNTINKQELSKKLINNDLIRKRTSEIFNIMQLLEQTGREIIWGVINYPNNNTDQYLDLISEEVEKFNGLMIYCNIEWTKVSLVYNISVPHLFIRRSPNRQTLRIYNMNMPQYKHLKTTFGKNVTDDNLAEYFKNMIS